MEAKRITTDSVMQKVVSTLFFLALFALPFINFIPAFTPLFIAFSVAMLFLQNKSVENIWQPRYLLFVLMAVYYTFQIIVFLTYKNDPYAWGAIERKVSLAVVPLVLVIAHSKDKKLWSIGINGLLAGIVIASICCLVVAIVRFVYTHDKNVFFYHEYSKIIWLNAIYFSSYILVALGYITINQKSFNKKKLISWLGVFLYLNLLLLSSKILIATGTLLLAIAIYMKLISGVYKKILPIGILSVFLLLSISNNPIKKRYTDIHIHNYTQALHSSNFNNFPFDGLSIRLLMWRMGCELIGEQHLWLFGAGGEQYHILIQPKMDKYGLYGIFNSATESGYKNYNMHNQYIESIVQFGLFGGIILISIIAYLLTLGIYKQNYFLIFSGLLFTIAFITESLLETQSGLLLFIIIISGEWIQLQKKELTTLK